MSEMETRQGKIKLVPNIEGETDYHRKGLLILDKLGIDNLEVAEEWGGDWEDALYETCSDNPTGPQYMIINEKIYEVIEDVELDSYGFVEVKKTEDGCIEYFASWYNGGGCLTEVLGNEIDKLK